MNLYKLNAISIIRICIVDYISYLFANLEKRPKQLNFESIQLRLGMKTDTYSDTSFLVFFL
jgi:hypothetical protein